MPRLLALLLLAPLAAAAPVPKAKTRERIEKEFGTINDPKGDTSFALDGDKLQFTLPADEVRDLTKRRDSAPRVEREVSGDFDLTVTISAPLDAKAKVAKGMSGDGVFPFVGGGVVFKGKDGWFTQGLSRWADGDEVQGGLPAMSPYSVVPKEYGSFDHCGPTPLPKDAETVTLKFLRRRERLNVEVTVDGKKLRGDIQHVGCTRDDPLTVALFASHGTNKSHTVTFSGYKLEAVTGK